MELFTFEVRQDTKIEGPAGCSTESSFREAFDKLQTMTISLI